MALQADIAAERVSLWSDSLGVSGRKDFAATLHETARRRRDAARRAAKKEANSEAQQNLANGVLQNTIQEVQMDVTL